MHQLTARWWWAMPPDRLRVALAIWELLSSSGGAVSLDVHSLSTALRTSRSTITRTLEDLELLGYVHTLSTAGRTGGTTVQQARPDWFAERITAANPPTTTLQNLNRKEPASAPAEQLAESIPEQFTQPLLDLPESPQKDPDPSSEPPGRSSNSEIQRNVTVPDPANMTNPPTPQPSTGQPTRRPAIDPTKIPRDAWRAADGLRARILKYKPGHRLSTRKWDTEAGDRLKWAHAFDLMVRVDKRGWLDISTIMRWLWPDDASKGPTPAARMFVIESADSLREKFDRVLAAQQREHSEAGKHAPADNRPAPAFKSWGES